MSNWPFHSTWARPLRSLQLALVNDNVSPGPRSRAMVWMPVEDGHRTIELLGHDQPHQHVRQRQRSE